MSVLGYILKGINLSSTYVWTARTVYKIVTSPASVAQYFARSFYKLMTHDVSVINISLKNEVIEKPNLREKNI